MQVRTTILVASVFLLGLFGSGCGYLDDDIFVDDATFEQELTFEGLSLRGYGGGHSCGGAHGYYHSHGHGSFLLTRRAAAPSVSLSDAEILENTNIDMIDESQESRNVATQPGLVEYMYHRQKAERDASILAVY